MIEEKVWITGPIVDLVGMKIDVKCL